ncbi:MAG: carbohydrate-binding family 9-like protein [Melioribacteraceae bacterium]|nr:carbohydrate-binding family 9-like protein [Melioribacteraceae bacterium]
MKKNNIVGLIIFLANTIFAQFQFPIPSIDYNPKTYTCYRSAELLSIDGSAFEESWIDAPWSDSFIDIEGLKKPLPYYDTKIKMLWDDAYLYFYAELEEEHIWANLRERDVEIYHDNDFEIFIDPDGDTHNYFELEVNALKTIWDLLLVKPYRDGRDVAIDAYDMRGIKVGVKIKGTLNDPSDKDLGWSVEIAIPWKTISELHTAATPPKDGDQWKLNFSRVQWKTDIKNGKYYKQRDKKTKKKLPEHNWVWSPQGIIAMHYPEMWGIVEFSYKVSNLNQPQIEISETEKAKWYLRKIYYKLRTFSASNKGFPNNLSILKLKEFTSEKFESLPKYYGNSKQYIIELTSKDKSTVVTLNNEGLVKVIKDKK